MTTVRNEKRFQKPIRPIHLVAVTQDLAMHEQLRLELAETKHGWCVHSCTLGKEAMAAVIIHQPQVVLIDQELPDGCGVDVAKRIRAKVPQLPVIIYAAQGCANRLMMGLMVGAMGYLVKSRAKSNWGHFLCKAIEGRFTICEQAERLLPLAFAGMRQNNSWRLTHREQEAMLWLCQNKSDKEIGESMGLATATIHVHLKRVFKKIGVHNRRQAIQKYLSGQGGDIKLSASS